MSDERYVELYTTADHPECFCKLFTVEKQWLEQKGLADTVRKSIEDYADPANRYVFEMATADGKVKDADDVYSSRQHDDGTIIGELLTEDKDGKENIKVLKGVSEQGFVFKDPIAFSRKTGICYIPEYDDFIGGYTYENFLEISEGNEEIAEFLFETVDWQHPETLLDECFSEGEIDHCPKCDKLYWSYEKKMCDQCADNEISICLFYIEWDTDGDTDALSSLPEDVVIASDDVDCTEAKSKSDFADIAINYLSDEYGFCIKGATMIVVKGGGNLPF